MEAAEDMKIDQILLEITTRVFMVLREFQPVVRTTSEPYRPLVFEGESSLSHVHLTQQWIGIKK